MCLLTVLADTAFIFVYQCIVTERSLRAISEGRFAVWMYSNSLFVACEYPDICYSQSIHWIRKIWNIKIRRGLCGHSVFFQLYLLFIVTGYF